MVKNKVYESHLKAYIEHIKITFDRVIDRINGMISNRGKYDDSTSDDSNE